MSSRFSELTAKWEPVFHKFRVQLAAATALVILVSALAVAGGDQGGPTGVSTTAAAPVDDSQALAPGEQPSEAATTAGPASTAGAARAVPRTVVRKGGLTITTAAGGVPEANLFTAPENRIGITDTGGPSGKGQIVICGHAATTFGPTFNTAPEDLNVYWQQLNESGGVHGRTVSVSWENDNYDPVAAQVAAQACKDKNPFIFLGGIGFDQIPTVREFVEQHHMLYIHHIARSDLSKKYSFAPLPTVELVGQRAGEWVRRTFPKANVGIIYRDSQWWIPGKEAFKKALGRPVVIERPVTRNQGTYFNEILAMRQANPTVDLVFAWANALEQTLMIEQAKDQQYHPQWIVFPFNLINDTLGDRALQPVLHGIATWSAYSPGGVNARRADNAGGPDPYAPYAGEIARFEAAYKKYRDVPLTDIHWMTWLAWKGIHTTFEQCGRDCNRNKVVGVMVTNPVPESVPTSQCPVDFTRNGREGGYWTSMFDAYRRANGTVGWKHIQHCKEGWS